MKVLIIGGGNISSKTLTEYVKHVDIVVIHQEDVERPKEEVFLIKDFAKIEPFVPDFPIKEQQPWKQKRKNNWKDKRRK